MLALANKGIQTGMCQNIDHNYARAEEILLESAGESAGKIIERFVKESDEWGGDRPQDDDATFVVIKVK